MTGRNRSRDADDAILGATLALLSEQGYASLTVAAVIERSGVSSATLYRRWATKHQLVVAALESLQPQRIDVDTGNLAGDLRAFVGHVARSIGAHREHVAEGLAREARDDPEFAGALWEKFLEPRLRELDEILDRAVDRGELDARPSAEVAYSLVAGPLYHRAYVLALPMTPTFLRTATAHAAGGLQARKPARSAVGRAG